MQKVHGIRAVPRPLSAGVEVDTHIQSFWDASHLFFHNIVPRLLDKLHGSLSHDRPRIFRDRMATFTGARKMAGQGGRHFKPNLGRSLPMSVWQVRLMMATFCCDGIASSNWVKLITNTWKLSCLALRSSGLSVADIASSQKLCLQVIQGLLRLGGRKKNSESAFFDLPCVHGLKELFFRTLPALRNGNFATVDSFETHHRQIKMSGGAGHEAFSFRRVLLKEAFVRMLHGMSWGPRHQFSLGNPNNPEVRNAWTDEMKRHSIFRSVTVFSGRADCLQTQGWTRTNGTVQKGMCLSDAQRRLLYSEVCDLDPGITEANIFLRLVPGFRRYRASTYETLMPGDNVQVVWNQRTAYAHTKGPFVEASWRDEVRLFFFPDWYTLYNRDENVEDEPALHSLRGTILLRSFLTRAQRRRLAQPGCGWTPEPIEVSNIVRRVHIVHSCRPLCPLYGENHANCRCDGMCFVKSICSRHEVEDCGSCPKKQHNAHQIHSPAQDIYEVLSSDEGIHFHRRRGHYND